MAAGLPIPQPPRTPSPLSDDDNHHQHHAAGLGMEHGNLSQADLNPHALSPYASRAGSMSSARSIPYGSWSPSSSTTSLAVESIAESQAVEGQPNPFGFQPTTYTVGRPPSKTNLGQRRGHKYKHSSVSAQIILEPEPRPPLRLPASLPIPTLKEGWKSMTVEQKIRLGWCFCHLFVAAYVQWTAQGSLALTALSHLIFYDAIGAFLCAGVEVLSNFEVWKRSSIRQPFGLERCEVVVGFAMSILLLFMGFDLISHNAGHLLENVGTHEPHHEHDHERVSSRNVDVACMLAIAVTLLSALMLKNHARIARAMHFASIPFLPSVLNNPSHLLTISCSGSLLLLPYLSFDVYEWLDKTFSMAMALLMCLMGYQLVKTLGCMLLMSYTGPGSVTQVLRHIETDPVVTAVEEAKIWQVHYGLCMANLKLRVRGTEDAMAKLRERINSLVKNQLGSSYDTGTGAGTGQHWEVSTQLTIEKD